VYAIAGLETTDATTPPRFIPYVMGVARAVLTSPQAHLMNVDLPMEIPLDHETNVIIANAPMQMDAAPNRFQIDSWIDLGGEGVIPRPDTRVLGSNASDPYRLVAEPAFVGSLADARMTIQTRYGTGDTFANPTSTVVTAGILTPDDDVRVDQWVGIPFLTAPMNGGTIPASRAITFDVTGNSPNMFWSVLSQIGSGCDTAFYVGDVVWWQHYFSGATRTFGVPDISATTGLTDLPHQTYRLSICGFNVPQFDYNNFTYQYEQHSFWSAYSTNSFTIAY
jgi:hypothetical protein